ncbi:unnamed protein product, partial [Eretmochelys imbricata]
MEDEAGYMVFNRRPKLTTSDRPCQSGTQERSGCKLCPTNWLLHMDKCYWESKEKAPWNKSRDFIVPCQLQAFIQITSKDINWIWLGLTITFPARKRNWVDGSLLNQTL